MVPNIRHHSVRGKAALGSATECYDHFKSEILNAHSMSSIIPFLTYNANLSSNLYVAFRAQTLEPNEATAALCTKPAWSIIFALRCHQSRVNWVSGAVWEMHVRATTQMGRASSHSLLRVGFNCGHAARIEVVGITSASQYARRSNTVDLKSFGSPWPHWSATQYSLFGLAEVSFVVCCSS